MIPEVLILRNFLSYREACLDLRGLHAACISGANGAGKSSLLEAIGWVLWGKGRAASADEAIHAGEREATVDFTFRIDQEAYRVIRTRRLAQTTSLEFQVAAAIDPPETRRFRSLTERGVEATQAAIIQRLRLDYDTFVNSAYLRQGRSDEFMLKKPAERKQVLAELLKLSQYEDLAEQAKERAKTLKFEADRLTEAIAADEARLAGRPEVAAQHDRLAEDMAAVTADLDRLAAAAAEQRAVAVQRQTWQQQQTWQTQRRSDLDRDLARLDRDWRELAVERDRVAAVLVRAEAIEAGAAKARDLQKREERLSHQAEHQSQLQADRDRLARTIERDLARAMTEQQQLAARLADLDRQIQDQDKVLAKADEVAAALAELSRARSHLAQLEQIQAEVTPLIQRQEAIGREKQQIRAHLQASLSQVQAKLRQAADQPARLASLERELQATIDRLATLEKRRVYQERVREKGLERKSFIDRLEASRTDLQRELAKLEEKRQLLRDRETDAASGADDDRDPTDLGLTRLGPADAFGRCPLCDRPLDEHHWQHVLEAQAAQAQELRDQLWIIHEQLAVTEQERQVLREEYRVLQDELKATAGLLERRGEIQTELNHGRDQAAAAEAAAIDLARLTATLAWLDGEGPAPADLPTVAAPWPDRQAEAAELAQRLAAVAWDDRNVALARGEVERWRWAELRQNDLSQAKKRRDQLLADRPQRLAEHDLAVATIARLTEPTAPDSPLPELARLDRALADLGYSLELHNQVRAELRQNQPWLTKADELARCREVAPQLDRRHDSLSQAIATTTADRDRLLAEINELAAQLAATPDPGPALAQIEQEHQAKRQYLDQLLADRGRLDQDLAALDRLEASLQGDRDHLSQTRRQQRVYEELVKAFGKNGIQTLAIETVLPQLEAEANRILSQLSANQLHVQFITQRARKTKTPKVGAKTRKKTSPGLALAPVAIDTLDILIADARGTRPYETYSGGEAFRIDFAIRLALSRLLAQRAGTSLQLLIIDEGFGTQDEAGRDRLVAAINAISPDFACILVVTHIPSLKEAFTSRIDVVKTAHGSQLAIA